MVTDRYGLEIGGPSGVFGDGGILPVYKYVRAMDNVVFSTSTVWEGVRDDGQNYVFHKNKPLGRNYVVDATDLSRIPADTYDFLFAAHCLEHIANPVRALHEWKRVLRPGGLMIVVLPNHSKTFDHKRPLTPVSHMLDDYRHNVTEDDPTHLGEILELHDLSRDPGAGSFEQFKERALKNRQYRCLHHHVFDPFNSRELLQAVGVEVWAVETAMPHHIVLATTAA